MRVVESQASGTTCFFSQCTAAGGRSQKQSQDSKPEALIKDAAAPNSILTAAPMSTYTFCFPSTIAMWPNSAEAILFTLWASLVHQITAPVTPHFSLKFYDIWDLVKKSSSFRVSVFVCSLQVNKHYKMEPLNFTGFYVIILDNLKTFLFSF